LDLLKFYVLSRAAVRNDRQASALAFVQPAFILKGLKRNYN